MVGCGQADAASRGAYQGIVELDERVLAFEVAGRIDEVPVDRGDEVEKGQVLATLDPQLAELAVQARQADLGAAQAQLDLLLAGTRPEDIRATRARLVAAKKNQKLIEDNLQRQQKLHGMGASTEIQLESAEARLAQADAERSTLAQQLRAQKRGAREQEIDTARAQVEAAQAALKLAQQQLDRHTLRSLEPATVLDVDSKVGEVVAPGTPVVTVADASHPYVDVFVPQADIGGIHIGNRARVRVDSLKKSLSGRVEDVSRKTEFTPRYLFSPDERPNLVIRVRVRIEDPHHLLHAGIPAFAKIHRGQR